MKNEIILIKNTYAVADNVIPTFRYLLTILYCFMFRKYLRIYMIKKNEIKQ